MGLALLMWGTVALEVVRQRRAVWKLRLWKVSVFGHPSRAWALGRAIWKHTNIWKAFQPRGLDRSSRCQAICRCMKKNNV